MHAAGQNKQRISFKLTDMHCFNAISTIIGGDHAVLTKTWELTLIRFSFTATRAWAHNYIGLGAISSRARSIVFTENTLRQSQLYICWNGSEV